MPQKRSNIDRQTRRTRNKAIRRANETDEHRSQRNVDNQQRMARSRSRSHTPQIDENDDSIVSNELGREQEVQRRRPSNTIQLNRAAFAYDAHVDYAAHPSVIIGKMDRICRFCRAYKYTNETPGMCCSSGKVRLPALNTPPEPLLSLLSGKTPQSSHFLTNIQSYNSCFQMTSFGATNIIRDNFMPTFKVISSLGLSNCSPATINSTEVFDVYSKLRTIQRITISHRNYRYKAKCTIMPDHFCLFPMLNISFCKFISLGMPKMKSDNDAQLVRM